MRILKISKRVPILALAAWATLSATAPGQLVPYRGHYGGWGAYPYGARSTYNTQSRIAANRQSEAQSRAMQQNRAVQQGIRNTLTSQSQTRTQNIVGQQQANRDWWFQTQQQQAARSSQTRRGPAPPTGEASLAAISEAARQVSHPGIIPWPVLLKRPLFNQERAIVEAPYLDRTAGGGPTVKDFQQMIKATEQMKGLLKDFAFKITAAEYLEAEKFLDQLAAEARGWIQKKAAETPASGSPEKEETGSQAVPKDRNAGVAPQPGMGRIDSSLQRCATAS